MEKVGMKPDNVPGDRLGFYIALTSVLDLVDPQKGINFTKTIPMDDMCEIAQKVNHDIVAGIHPENGNLEAAVIAHTLLCETCAKLFLQESKDAEQNM